MCEIFPEVSNCCMCLTLRIGMLCISILAVVSGAITLSVVEKTSNTSFDNLKNVTNIRDASKAYSSLGSLIQSAITFMSVCFMLVGVILLLSTLAGSEGMVQIFVWVTFLNVIIGFVAILLITMECLVKTNQCLVGGMDWLSGATVLVMLSIYLFVWIYFIIVANSYVLNGD
ncbi:hypothetical protein K1T71_013715 [Dendrolimus kikuchii]|uniref:Uncharacterized protein n=1 Tax=Dendrolimus kikuchii TaxID=765133 RepID=A0ACC1CH76_9NEOP|nr:hypothetical protein K1T71_013715 [Dendrolimus kikuchii]